MIKKFVSNEIKIATSEIEKNTIFDIVVISMISAVLLAIIVFALIKCVENRPMGNSENEQIEIKVVEEVQA